MRYSPDRQLLIYTRGYGVGDGPVRLELHDVASGQLLHTFTGGHNPRWSGSRSVAVESPDGVERTEIEAGVVVRYIPANRGQLDAVNGRRALSDLQQTVVEDLETRRTVFRARDPRLSASGVLAARVPETGHVFIQGVVGAGDLGPATVLRWSSETLLWAHDGRVWGRTTPDQPTVDLTPMGGHVASQPLPRWTGLRLYVGLVLRLGALDTLWVFDWGELVSARDQRRRPFGRYVGTSDGAGFDWDLCSDAGGLLEEIAYLSPEGRLVRARFEDLTTRQLPPAAPDWTRVPDGTVVYDGLDRMFGRSPSLSPDGRRVYLPKNTPPEAEWREIWSDPQTGPTHPQEIANTRIDHLWDQSRRPGDPGWFLYPRTACLWGYDHFVSGQPLPRQRGEILDLDPANPVSNRWTHQVTLYALQNGGLEHVFDPRFPNQDYGQGKGYERTLTSPDGWARWEYRYTPVEAKGVLAWGDSSRDVIQQETQSWTPPWSDEPVPYTECPRVSCDDDSLRRVPAPDPDPDPEPEPMPDTFTLAQIDAVLATRPENDFYLGARERLRREVLAPRDQFVSAITAEGQPGYTGDVMTGGAEMAYGRSFWPTYYRSLFRGSSNRDAVVAGFHAGADDYKIVAGIVQPPPGPVPGTPITHRLEVRNGRLAAGDQWVNYQGVSCFALIGHAMQGRKNEVHRQLDECAGRPVRVFAMLDPLNGGFGPVTRFSPLDSEAWIAAADFVIHEAAFRGSRVQLNIFADAQRICPNTQVRFDVLGRVARRYKNHPAVWFRIANEAYQNGWSRADDPQLLELADALADILGHRDFGITDVPDSGAESGSPEQEAQIRALAARSNVLLSHPDRAESPGRERPVEHLKSVAETYQRVAPDKYLLFDEPRGMASQRQPGRRDNRPAIPVAEACTAAVLGAGYTYHRIAEQDPATPGLRESLVALQVPADPAYRFENANTGDAWVRTFGGWDKVRPCHNGQDGWAAAIGPRDGTVNVGSGWAPAEVVTRIASDGVVFVLYRGRRA